MKDRIYVCHTYYHVYVSFLKEYALDPDRKGGATILLSSLSTDFETLGERLGALDFFEEVLEFDEKRDTFFPELAKWKKNHNNLILNMLSRIIFTKKYAKLEAAYIPVDFKEYQDIYVYCDSDPVGYYLNQNRIAYHAMEDGINCLKIYDAARYDNRGCFGLKVLLSKWNLIFIQNGYGKYCIDMEINDRSCLKYDCKKYKEVPRKPMEEALTAQQKEMMIRAFVQDADRLLDQIVHADKEKKNIMLLTEQLCTLPIREQIFRDIIREYCDGARVFIKPHPRDELDYETLFPEHIVIKGKFPMEVLNLMEGIHFHQAIAVFTQAVYEMEFVDEILFLGEDFMDQYEDPDVHRYNDKI